MAAERKRVSATAVDRRLGSSSLLCRPKKQNRKETGMGDQKVFDNLIGADGRKVRIDLSDKNRPASIYDLHGIAPDATGDLSSEDFTAMLRGLYRPGSPAEISARADKAGTRFLSLFGAAKPT